MFRNVFIIINTFQNVEISKEWRFTNIFSMQTRAESQIHLKPYTNVLSFTLQERLDELRYGCKTLNDMFFTIEFNQKYIY